MTTSQSNTHRVWFITGTSQGFGRELVRAALQRRDSVIATSRQPQAVAAAFSKASDRLLALPMDLRDRAQIASVVERAIARFGCIDVLVNNAGYGVTGAVEEASEKEITAVYDTNVFGLLRVTRAILPHMRKQRTGHIVNLSSIGGLTGLPGWGIYNSTKFAVEGLSEALAAELAPLGIGVTLVEPGPFRTDFLGGSLVKAANTLPDYEATAGKTRAGTVERNGKQQGDPALAADAIVQAVTSPEPPLHLLLGRWAYDRFNQKLDALRHEMEAWREIGLGTDFKS
ncbi:MAG: short-chain dehydrogenase/reductase [Acidobacteria bacterium]|nr:MAG: short-chain dehydrogenase/reductase [Acidobacteriota bacterium]